MKNINEPLSTGEFFEERGKKFNIPPVKMNWGKTNPFTEGPDDIQEAKGIVYVPLIDKPKTNMQTLAKKIKFTDSGMVGVLRVEHLPEDGLIVVRGLLDGKEKKGMEIKYKDYKAPQARAAVLERLRQFEKDLWEEAQLEAFWDNLRNDLLLPENGFRVVNLEDKSTPDISLAPQKEKDLDLYDLAMAYFGKLFPSGYHNVNEDTIGLLNILKEWKYKTVRDAEESLPREEIERLQSTIGHIVLPHSEELHAAIMRAFNKVLGNNAG